MGTTAGKFSLQDNNAFEKDQLKCRSKTEIDESERGSEDLCEHTNCGARDQIQLFGQVGSVRYGCMNCEMLSSIVQSLVDVCVVHGLSSETFKH